MTVTYSNSLEINQVGFKKNNYMAWPGYILFFMLLFLPSMFQTFKGLLLGIVICLILLNALEQNRLPLHPTVFLWTLFIVTAGLWFMFVGGINNAPGALRNGTVFVIWPIAFIILATSLTNDKHLDNIMKLLIIALIIIIIHSLYYFASTFGLVPHYSLLIDLYDVHAAGLYTGFARYRLQSKCSLIFLVPFFFAALLTWPKSMISSKGRFWGGLVLIFGFALSILSGTKVLWIVVALTPVISTLFRLFLPREERRQSRKRLVMILFITVVSAILIYYSLHFLFGITIEGMLDFFMLGFEWDSDRDAYPRKEQAIALLQAWLERPLFGGGLGNYAPGCIRVPESPWSYELAYLALLFHTGLVGFAIYTAGVIWIFAMGIKMIRTGNRLGLYILPVLVGTSCFLIANATNPYLATFDYMWVIFLPLGLINAWLLKDRKAPNCDGKRKQNIVESSLKTKNT